MIIDDNYLMLSKMSEFSTRLSRYFYRRLQLFLCVSDTKCPKIIFSADESKLRKYYGTLQENGPLSRAFYDEKIDGGVIGLYARRYDIKATEFSVPATEIEDLRAKYDFRYIIPLSDIYHEMIHHIQFQSISTYDYIDFLEAIDDSFTYCITGHWNIDYLTESIGFWRVCTEVLGLKEVDYYILLRDAIVNDEFEASLLKHPKFIKLLAKRYNGDYKQFLHGFKKDYGDRNYEEAFYVYMKRIHDLIFYRY